ncbi:MAG: hypothetical protein HQK61_10155 [Desulfamplus sp.]|nr:hypothetical protein [Desulfamplus sp.]
MSNKVKTALARLMSILPLKERQENCGKEIKALHQMMLRSFVDKGCILTRDEMAQHVGNIDHAIKVLVDNDMVVFSKNGDPVGAYPFTMEVREHKIRVNGQEIHAMCALDSLAVSPMFGMKTRISSVCRVSGEPVFINQSGKIIENETGAADVCFGIAWGAASSCTCCAKSLCMEMMFLKDSDTATCWLEQNPDDREIFTLQEAVDFSALFFLPLMS